MKKTILKSSALLTLIFMFSLAIFLFLPINSSNAQMIFTPQVDIPGGVSGETPVGTKEGATLLGQYIKGIYDYSFAVGGILAAIVLMGGGVLWLVSGGNQSKVSKAKDIISGSLIGLGILFSGYLLFNTINPALLEMKPITSITTITGTGGPTTCEEAMDFNSCTRLGFCYWQEEKCVKKSDTGAVLCSVNKSDIQEKFPNCCCEQNNGAYVNCKWAVGGRNKYCAASCGQTYTQVDGSYCPSN